MTGNRQFKGLALAWIRARADRPRMECELDEAKAFCNG